MATTTYCVGVSETERKMRTILLFFLDFPFNISDVLTKNIIKTYMTG